NLIPSPPGVVWSIVATRSGAEDSGVVRMVSLGGCNLMSNRRTRFIRTKQKESRSDEDQVLDKGKTLRLPTGRPGPLKRATMRCLGISLHDLVDVWMEYNSLLGQMYMATYLPQMMADVTNNALNRDVVCPRCDGLKNVRDGDAESRICPVCKGEGSVTVPGDPHAIELVFEALALVFRRLRHAVDDQDLQRAFR